MGKRSGPKSGKAGNDTLVYGRQPVLGALRGNRKVKEIYLLEGGRGESVKALRQEGYKQGLTVKTASRAQLDAIAGTPDHQGVVAFTEPYLYCRVRDLLRSKNTAPFLLMLDHLQDPQNLGSILRSAEAAGVDGVIIPDRRAVMMTPAVFKAAAGAAEVLSLAKVVNLSRTVTDLKEEGFWVIGAEAGKNKNYTDADLPYDLPLLLVIGSEGKGISRLLKEQCDFLVSIPMRGQISSLNASVAAALLLYAVLQRRLEVD